tara:strand:+ start:758 stop:976 length:219 start_codon:yes stop_codon:yes gene_type:complete
MEYINGYKYTTEAQAKDAVKACNEHYLPNVKESTLNWVKYQAELDEPAFFYILHNPSLNEVLGEPIKIEINK